jgi:hypothetical protein
MSLVKYISYPDTNLTYFFSDGSNITYYKSVGQFNSGEIDWMLLLTVAYIVVILCYVVVKKKR